MLPSRGQVILTALLAFSWAPRCVQAAFRQSRSKATAAFVRPAFRPRPTLLRRSMSTSSGASGPFNFSWQQTMIRIKDPKKSLPFYEEVLGFRRLHEYHFDSFSLYFLLTPRPGEEADKLPQPGTKESEAYLWSMPGTVLELTWNHGTEAQADFKYNNGNVEPNRGFGHIAIACNDVYEACAKFEQAGVEFQKKPDEGRMKGLAFLKDPDGYWVEVVRRDASAFGPSYPYNLAQTMIRVKDPQKSLGFYRDLLGMHLVAKRTFSDFSLFFLAQRAPEGGPFDPESQEAYEALKRMHDPVLELTHNHGTESDPAFSYHNGNTEPRGFGHTGFLCDDLEGACKHLEEAGVRFQKRPQDGSMRGLAFALDPDGYWVELVGRGLTV